MFCLSGSLYYLSPHVPTPPLQENISIFHNRRRAARSAQGPLRGERRALLQHGVRAETTGAASDVLGATQLDAKTLSRRRIGLFKKIFFVLFKGIFFIRLKKIPLVCSLE